MHRQDLLRKLQRHKPLDDYEAASLKRIIAFVRAHSQCFERSLAIGHVTGSAWLLNSAGTHALLTHHRKLNLWLQPGGHADGNPDVLDVALREAREESGLDAITPLSQDIFDVDVHDIPSRNGEPAHQHYDVRFILQAQGCDRFRISSESLALKWVCEQGLSQLDTDESVRRMFRKWLAARETVP